VTNSGGVMVAKVKQIGLGLQNSFRYKVGDMIIPVASISCIPLHLIQVFEFQGDIVRVSGTAILNGKLAYMKTPTDMSLTLALSALDISRAIPLLESTTTRIMKENPKKLPITVFVIGCGKKIIFEKEVV
jgi:L-erythro-3,5-diaminohexanoate dehydrogenase